MKKTFFIVVLGCQMNESDAERIRGLCCSLGMIEAKSEEAADIIIVVSCAVRQAAMDRIYGRIEKWNAIRKERTLFLILTGCVLPADQEKLRDVFDVFLPIKEIGSLFQILADKLAVNVPESTSSQYFSIEPSYYHDYKAYVPIMTGCNKFCTYCAVPYTRGREISRPYSDIMNEINGLVEKGYKEIMLLGQNVNSYALDLPDQSEKFPELLKSINDIEGDFWIRIMTSHPYDMSNKLIDVLAEKKHICESFHLPIQSGDDHVLVTMNRHYTVQHFMDRIKSLRDAIPDISISTDIIVGFPTEDEIAFENTVRIVKECAFDMAYIARYSERPGTVAEKTIKDNISDEEKMRREKIINDIITENAINYNQRFLNKTVRTLVDEAAPSKETNGLFKNTGKNRENKTVIFKSGRDYTGLFVDVKITKIHAFALEGEVV